MAIIGKSVTENRLFYLFLAMHSCCLKMKKRNKKKWNFKYKKIALKTEIFNSYAFQHLIDLLNCNPLFKYESKFFKKKSFTLNF